jgi:hypothetical protein
MTKKKSLGQYFTKNQLWLDDLTINFLGEYDRVVDPFAGDGDLLKLFPNTLGYDIDPTLNWQINDSLLSIPKGDGGDVCVTNPPYLAKNWAVRRKLVDTYRYFEALPEYDDLYQLAIKQCLLSFDKVVAIVPETYISASHFKDRLSFVNIIEGEMFSDTQCPVLVAAWDKVSTPDFEVYKNSSFVANWQQIVATLPAVQVDQTEMKFNDPDGDLGIICFDNTTEKSIRFCHGAIVPRSEIKHTSRLKTRIAMGNVSDDLIVECNRILASVRETSSDIIMSPWRGNMKTGERRRRLDFALARRIINLAVNNLKQ